MMDPYAYTISVRRSEFDGETCFEATVKELPNVAEYAESYEEAYSLAIDTIETTAAIFSEKGKAMPEPKELHDDYSGRITLRIPTSLHCSLVTAADDEGISLNQYLASVLSYHTGFCHAQEKAVDLWGNIISQKVQNKVKTYGLKLVSSSPINNELLWKEA